MGEVLVGTCGYGYYDPGAGWKDEYESKLAAFAAEFDALEVNRTFYELPQVRTTERWRREVGAEFVFTMKAWQAITHPRSSPTWNNHRDALPTTGTPRWGLTVASLGAAVDAVDARLGVETAPGEPVHAVGRDFLESRPLVWPVASLAGVAPAVPRLVD